LKRDVELIRQILMEVEKSDSFELWESRPLLSHSERDVVAHIQMAQEAGLLDAFYTAGPQASVKRLTNDGHNFIVAAKNPGVWERAKTLASEKVGVLTLDVLKVALTEVVNHLWR
jgi:hypothetical protein